MFGSINEAYRKQRADRAADEFILTESVIEVDAEAEDEIDEDSVPEEAMVKITKAIDDVIDDDEYDDAELDELIEEELGSGALDIVLDECASMINY